MKDVLIQGRPTMAAHLKVSVQTLMRLEQRGLPIRLRSGPEGHIYDVAKVMAWYQADKERQELRPAKFQASDEIKQVVARKAEADARRAEIEVGKLEESLGDISLIRACLEGVMINQRTILLGLPAEIGRDIDDPEIRVRVVQLADRRVREALEAMSNYDPVITTQSVGAGEADDAGDLDGDQAAAQVDRQPVGRAKAVSQPRRRGKHSMAQ